jgi:multimeric flavodoxin WrbA
MTDHDGDGRGVPEIVKLQPGTALTREEFERRLGERFFDPAFDAVRGELANIMDVAWNGYHEYRKSPRTRKAGAGFADPDFDLPMDWHRTREAIDEAQRRHESPEAPRRVLLVSAAARSNHTCPGESPKTYRLAQLAREVFEAEEGFECDFLDLSALTAEYGRQILPCKSCVATAMPLCHWPCSCYPNHAMGQVNDWMNELYPRWVAAHGVMIVTPVYWHSPPSTLKLMMDRLVCADGGNPDLTSTQGKSAEKAKAIELEGWAYPRHLAGRLFATVVHGDAGGAESVRRVLTDWLSDMHLEPAGANATIDRYIGYMEPYATSHEALDADVAVQEETRNVARTLVDALRLRHRGRHEAAGEGLSDPRAK